MSNPAVAEKVLDAALQSHREKLQQSRWYRRNASARHGVFYDDDGQPLNVTHEHNHSHDTTGPTPPTGTGSATSAADWLKKGVLYAGLLGLGAGVPILAWQLWQGGRDEAPPRRSSLLQDLEDRGFHLPE